MKKITCWFVLSAAGCVNMRLLARRAENPNSRLKMFRLIRVIIYLLSKQNQVRPLKT